MVSLNRYCPRKGCKRHKDTPGATPIAQGGTAANMQRHLKHVHGEVNDYKPPPSKGHAYRKCDKCNRSNPRGWSKAACDEHNSKCTGPEVDNRERKTTGSTKQARADRKIAVADQVANGSRPFLRLNPECIDDSEQVFFKSCDFLGYTYAEGLEILDRANDDPRAGLLGRHMKDGMAALRYTFTDAFQAKREFGEMFSPHNSSNGFEYDMEEKIKSSKAARKLLAEGGTWNTLAIVRALGDTTQMKVESFIRLNAHTMQARLPNVDFSEHKRARDAKALLDAGQVPEEDIPEPWSDFEDDCDQNSSAEDSDNEVPVAGSSSNKRSGKAMTSSAAKKKKQDNGARKIPISSGGKAFTSSHRSKAGSSSSNKASTSSGAAAGSSGSSSSSSSKKSSRGKTSNSSGSKGKGKAVLILESDDEDSDGVMLVEPAGGVRLKGNRVLDSDDEV